MTLPTPAEILSLHARYGWSTPPGEWGFIQQHARREYRDLLDYGDPVELGEMLARMFRSPALAGLVGFDYRDMGRGLTDKVAAMVRENVSLWSAYTDGELHMLESPGTGAAPRFDVDGVVVMFDTPRHDHYAQRLAALIPSGGTVLEIGGGYGGAALQTLRHRPDARYVTCDLPETLYLALYWLREAGVSVRWHGDGVSDVTLLPRSELDEWTGHADVVLAAHSLSEVGASEAQRYVTWLDRHAPSHVYYDHPHGSTDRRDPTEPNQFAEVQATDVRPGPRYREVYRAPTLWPNTGGRYWEFLYERKDG